MVLKMVLKGTRVMLFNEQSNKINRSALRYLCKSHHRFYSRVKRRIQHRVVVAHSYFKGINVCNHKQLRFMFSQTTPASAQQVRYIRERKSVPQLK